MNEMSWLDVVQYIVAGFLIAPLFGLAVFVLSMLGMSLFCVFVWICDFLWIRKDIP